ncbi:MAG: hypothetical protein SD837_14865 [Candidatus Electrothrix scaldis]|nr:MAG: hypothetical protein SD837_14865 [Candidatus Electrothrix sp. GW3-3]
MQQLGIGDDTDAGMWRQSGDNHQGSWFDPARAAIGRGRTFAQFTRA